MQLVSKDHKDKEVCKELKANREHLVKVDSMAVTASRATLVVPALEEWKARRVRKVRLVLKDLLDWWGRRDAQVYKVRQGHRVLDQLGRLVLLVPEEMLEELENKAQLVLPDHKDCEVLVEPLDSQDLQDHLVHQALLDPKGLEVIQVSVAYKVQLVP